MGFNESLVVDALRMFNNSKDEAVRTILNCYFKNFIEFTTLID